MLTITVGLLVLNPSIFAQAQPYNDGYYDKKSYYKDDTYRYGYDHNDKKKDINIEKIICDNKKINIIGNLDVNPGDFATTTDAGEAIATGEENGETGSDSVTTSNGIGDRKKFDNDKDLLVDCRSFNTNIVVGPGEPVLPPIEIEGCEGCFIDLVAGNEANAQALIDTLEEGIIITLVNVNGPFNSLFSLCFFLDLATSILNSPAINEEIVHTAVEQIITQLQNNGAVFTDAQITTFEDCLLRELGIST